MTNQEIYSMACGQSREALDFLQAWTLYAHAIDDIVDNDRKDPEKFIDTLALANCVYSSSFYQAYNPFLRSIVLSVTNDFADSLKWEKATEEWKARWADTLRFCGNQMVVAVATIVGGWQLARQVSLLLREDSYMNHHKDGQPI